MASDFWLIAGLGNPGRKYEDTRHNMGFMTADLLAERWSVAFSDHKGLAMLGKGAMNLNGRTVKFFLAKPLTYMNDSGNAVASISAYYQIEPDRIVVIHDDMDLDFGRIKVKSGGSAGGHNGIKSIDKSLGTPKYAPLTAKRRVPRNRRTMPKRRGRRMPRPSARRANAKRVRKRQ